MGFLFATGDCVACGQLFTFNPDLVPSVRYPPPDGPRLPVCRSCVERVNPRREQNGLAKIEILPGAYEPQEE